METIQQSSLEEQIKNALVSFNSFIGQRGFSRKRHIKKAIKSFIEQHPEEAQTLVQRYNSKHLQTSLVYRLNHFGKSPNEEDKIKDVIGSSRLENYGRVRRFIIKHPKLLLLAITGQGILSSLSPTHPIAVDSYLARQAYNSITRNTPAINQEELEEFLTTREQVERYREDFLEDLKDTSSEKGFVIVEDGEGRLKQKPIRSIHENLPDYIPSSVKNLLDRHNVSRLDNSIDLERGGDKIIASGHYHVFGEMPSLGDRLAQVFSFNRYTIEIANGLVYCIYVDGKFLPFKNTNSIKIPKEVEVGFFSNIINPNFGLIPPNLLNSSQLCDKNSLTKIYLESAINYLSLVNGHNIDDLKTLREDIERSYDVFFEENSSYRDNPNKNYYGNLEIFLSRQQGIYSWAKNLGKERKPLFNEEFLKRFKNN